LEDPGRETKGRQPKTPHFFFCKGQMWGGKTFKRKKIRIFKQGVLFFVCGERGGGEGLFRFGMCVVGNEVRVGNEFAPTWVTSWASTREGFFSP